MLHSPGPWRDGWSLAQLADLALTSEVIPRDEFFSFSRSRGQLLAALWCKDTKLAVSETPYENTMVVTYEFLVSDPEEALKRIFDFLENPIPQSVWRELDRVSNTTNRDSIFVRTGDRLGGWRQRLSDTVIDEVLSVLRQGKIKFYGTGVMPDETELANQIQSWRD